MSKEPIGVGVIGASARNPGWAMIAHIPAIQALPEFELRAVSTSSPDSAKVTQKALGVPSLSDSGELILRPDVDLVVVAVKVPLHYDLTLAALEAGKAVFTEWPLSTTLDRSRRLATRARELNARTIIGLQARYSPAVQHARRLVQQGYIGQILSTNLIGTGMIWGDAIPKSFAYTLDSVHGAGVLPVPMMHALEAVAYVVGEFATVNATAAVRRPTVKIVEDGSVIQASAFDHIAVTGHLESGAIASVQMRGAPSRADNLRWEINGTEGDLLLTANNGNLQVAELTLHGGRGQQDVINKMELTEAGPASVGFGANTLHLYSALAMDMQNGTHHVPGFAHAWHRHRLLTAIEAAIESGCQQDVV
jgi:predicted dehydrogenase